MKDLDAPAVPKFQPSLALAPLLPRGEGATTHRQWELLYDRDLQRECVCVCVFVCGSLCSAVFSSWLQCTNMYQFGRLMVVGS